MKVMYIYEGMFKKYDLWLDAGKYSITDIHQKVLERVSKDRKEVKSGKKTLIFADLRQSTFLIKFFTEQVI